VDEIGNILREAREAKGFTLAEAEDSTRINRKFLDALENGEYERLPTAVHIRGYLRNYARYLDLDSSPLLERYEFTKDNRPLPSAAQPMEDLSSMDPLPEREDQVFFDPVNMELAGGGKRDSGSLMRLIIIAALIVAVALVANRFIPLISGNGDGTEALTSGIQEAVEAIVNEEEPTPTVTIDPLLIPGAGETITSTNRNAAIVLPTPSPTRPLLPATLETIRLRLEITERAWMRVTIDGEVVFEGMARKGDEPYEWEAQDEATVLTGNAIGIFVTINETQLGKLGGRGEVVEETWTTTGNG
jgi:transcriptional regulator with XRE-family HTH domain